jgi:hypothetical protein
MCRSLPKLERNILLPLKPIFLRPLFAIFLFALACCAPAARGAAPAATVQFAGYTWRVRAGSGGPGPNTWDASNVWVDGSGALHLKIAHANGAWTCAELETTERFGFGTYQFQLDAAIDKLDPNVVLGLFTYPPDDVGPDTTNEIDIEFARWGAPANPNGNYTVWPAELGRTNSSHTFELALNGTYTTQRFHWSHDAIVFQSLHGHTDTDANEFARWDFRPSTFAQDIPQRPVPLHLNLWLFGGHAPTDGKEVEIVVSALRYTPPGQVFVPLAAG